MTWRCMAAVLAIVSLAAAHPLAQAWNTQALVREAGGLEAADLPALEKRANAGDARAQALLGLAYEMGSAGLEPNAVQALAWLRKAADQGTAWAEMWAADFYYTGSQGVPRDLFEAMRLYQSAALRGEARAAYYAGRMYFFGDGVATDFREAAVWFRRALPADPDFVGRMVALADAPCAQPFCVALRQMAGAVIAQVSEQFLGEWDEVTREWEAARDLPGDFTRCGFTSTDRTPNGDVENYFCDSDRVTDAAAGNALARALADEVAAALPEDWSRSMESLGEGSAHHFRNDGYPRVRVSYNARPGSAWERVTILIGP